MEFHEKLQELRRCKGLTQEELAEVLYVSRTAVSKWESGRGYPSIDSLKQISSFFNVTIDELLSGDALLSIAEKENRSNLRRAYDRLLGIADLLAVLLIILPLYPETVGGYVYSVDLPAYDDVAAGFRMFYWMMYSALIMAGAVKLLLTKYRKEMNTRIVSDISVMLNILMVIFLILSRETYAAALAVMILMIKMIFLLKHTKAFL